jgi:hypothetical protein
MNAQPDQLAFDLASPRRRPSLSFWHPLTGALDKKYLRVCSVYRLLRKKRIGQARAMELLAQRHTASEMKTLRGTVELWRAHPLKDMLP